MDYVTLENFSVDYLHSKNLLFDDNQRSVSAVFAETSPKPTEQVPEWGINSYGNSESPRPDEENPMYDRLPHFEDRKLQARFDEEQNSRICYKRGNFVIRVCITVYKMSRYRGSFLKLRFSDYEHEVALYALETLKPFNLCIFCNL